MVVIRYSAFVLERVWRYLTEPLEQMEQRVDLDPSVAYPDIDAQLFTRQNARTVPYKPTIREAMGIPAVWRAITLLATTAASLNLKEYQNQIEIPASPFVRRPSRGWTPGAFIRDTVMYMATRGEAIWLITARGFGGVATDAIPIPPELMKSEWDNVSHQWWIEQGGRRTAQDPANVIHIPLMRNPQTGRGDGPLQVCGVALNVAVEADRWANRFFVGGIPSVFLNSAQPINKTEADIVKNQWLEDPPNLPKVGYGFEPTTLQVNPEVAQLTESRTMTRGETALMFGINGRLMEYAASGSSLSYQNVGDLATELVRLTLAPQYLEPIEQAFSDLLQRGHEVRFDVEGFQRADPKTRYEVYRTGIETGMFTPEYAAGKEGIEGTFEEVRPAPLRRVG